MISRAFVDNAKVMSKGQVTIPKDVRDVLGVANGASASLWKEILYELSTLLSMPCRSFRQKWQVRPKLPD